MSENDTDDGGVDRLIGCYEYRGNGDWYLIKEPWWDDADADIVADTVNYSSVPIPVRERAYEEFKDDPVFIEPEEVSAE